MGVLLNECIIRMLIMMPLACIWSLKLIMGLLNVMPFVGIIFQKWIIRMLIMMPFVGNNLKNGLSEC